MNGKDHENIKENEKPLEKNGSSEKPKEEKKETSEIKSEGQSSQDYEIPVTEKNCLNSENDFQKKITELQEKYNEINDKYLRLYSDFDNYRKRTARERVDLIKYSEEELITLLLPILDDFERANKSIENSKDNKAMKEGVHLVFQKLKNILIQKGLKELEIKDGIFNSDLHEAITKVPVTDKNQKGKIIEIIEKGYLLNDKMIRHAKVVVGD